MLCFYDVLNFIGQLQTVTPEINKMNSTVITTVTALGEHFHAMEHFFQAKKSSCGAQLDFTYSSDNV